MLHLKLLLLVWLYELRDRSTVVVVVVVHRRHELRRWSYCVCCIRRRYLYSQTNSTTIRIQIKNKLYRILSQLQLDHLIIYYLLVRFSKTKQKKKIEILHATNPSSNRALVKFEVDAADCIDGNDDAIFKRAISTIYILIVFSLSIQTHIEI